MCLHVGLNNVYMYYVNFYLTHLCECITWDENIMFGMFCTWYQTCYIL